MRKRKREAERQQERQNIILFSASFWLDPKAFSNDTMGLEWVSSASGEKTFLAHEEAESQINKSDKKIKVGLNATCHRGFTFRRLSLNSWNLKARTYLG